MTGLFGDNRSKRVAAIHDLSGAGRCSLSVILPILSVMGIEVCPVPTAVLSTHTGGFPKVEIRNLDDYMQPCLERYREIGLHFDSIYSGFLGSVEQIDHCLEFYRAYPEAVHLVDPVMGDNGKPYRTYTSEMIRRMGELICCADIITPNLTEGYLLLGESYRMQAHTTAQIKSMLVRLSEKGPSVVVITGVPLMGERMANVGYDREHNTFWRINCHYMPVFYPGTGDIFSAVLLGSLLNRDSLPMAMAQATKFIERAIKTTYSFGSQPRFGVMFEGELIHLGSGRIDNSDYEIL